MKLKVRVFGPKVHGVGYRGRLMEMADTLDIPGFSAVNRLEEGKQVLYCFVEGEGPAILEFRRYIELEAPKRAEVEGKSFDTSWDGTVPSLQSFAEGFLRTQFIKGLISLQEMEIIQNKMLDKQDQMLEKQDGMLDKQDQMLEKQDRMLDKQDQMIGKQEEILGIQCQTLESIKNANGEIVGEIRKTRETLTSEIRQARTELADDIKDALNDHKQSLEERLGRVESDVSQIKARIGL